MKIGDGRKAIVMGLACSAAIVFLIQQLISATAAASASHAAKATTATESFSSSAPNAALARDPFSSEELATAAVRPTNETQQESGPRLKKRPVRFDPLPSAVEGSIEPETIPGNLPAENSQVSRHDSQGSKESMTIRVEATANGSTQAAMISINGAEADSFKPGDALGAHAKILSIDGAGILVRCGKGVRHINVGEETQI